MSDQDPSPPSQAKDQQPLQVKTVDHKKLEKNADALADLRDRSGRRGWKEGPRVPTPVDVEADQ